MLLGEKNKNHGIAIILMLLVEKQIHCFNTYVTRRKTKVMP